MWERRLWRDSFTTSAKVILDTHFNDQYQDVMEEMIDEGRSAVDVETDVLNIDHAEVGGWRSTRWIFPDALIVPITYHHNLVGGEGENLNFALMVHLANILTKKNDIGLNHELEIPEPSDMVEEVLGLDDQKVNSISEELNNAKSYIQEFFRYLKE